MKTKEETTILERLSEYPLELAIVLEGLKHPHEHYITNLILQSSAVAVRAKLPWEYKSLTVFGEEDFVRSGNIYIEIRADGHNPKNWHHFAAKEFARSVTRSILYEHDEGLVLFVKDGERYRPARLGDPAYDFVKRMMADNMDWDYVMDKPPSWADELFVNKQNLDAYACLWYDADSSDSPLYPTRESKKRVKREAVWLETLRFMECQPYASLVVPAPEKWSDIGSSGEQNNTSETAISIRERTTYLNTIGVMLEQLTAGTANDTTVITRAVDTHGNKYGISKRKLEEVFAAAKRSLKAS